jgi:hypothetical protein
MLPRADITTSIERWATIARLPGYEFSDLGRARTYWQEIRMRWGGSGRAMAENPRLLKPFVTSRGYFGIVLCDDRGRRAIHQLHRIILEAFVGPCPDGHEGCHKDGSRTNARLDNLYWGTRSQNNFDRVQHGRHPLAKMSDEQVAEAMRLHGEGWSFVALAERYGVRHGSIRNRLMNRGVPRSFSHVGEDERLRIELLDALGFRRKDIAKMIGRNTMTLKRILGPVAEDPSYGDRPFLDPTVRRRISRRPA